MDEVKTLNGRRFADDTVLAMGQTRLLNEEETAVVTIMADGGQPLRLRYEKALYCDQDVLKYLEDGFRTPITMYVST